MTIVNLAAYRERVRLRSTKALSPALSDIMDALQVGGGALHRSTVVRQVAAWRGVRNREDLAALDTELQEAFEDYIRYASRSRKPALLRKPLGFDSYRWAITDAGRDLLEGKGRVVPSTSSAGRAFVQNARS